MSAATLLLILKPFATPKRRVSDKGRRKWEKARQAEGTSLRLRRRAELLRLVEHLEDRELFHHPESLSPT